MNTDTQEQKLLGPESLLARIFEEDKRPSIYWLRDQRRARKIPFVRVGRLIFYDPDDVREALRKNFTVKGVS